MTNGPGRSSRGPADRASSPLTIGFLTHYFSRDDISLDLWLGIIEQAREENINVICFPGNAPQSPVGFDSQANIIYNMVDRRSINGLLVWGSGMLGSSNAENVKFLFDSFRDVPTVDIGLALEGIPAIIIDNYQGMYRLCEHLIEAHGCRRLAFVRGPVDHPEADLRFTAYKDALREHGLAYDPRFVVTGNFLRAAARNVMQSFLDKCPAVPDAVVAVNDLSAMGVIDELSTRGISIPDRIKVVGFDDLEESQYLKVPLTTVRQPFYEIGRMAVNSILSLIRGEKLPPVTTIPSRLIARQSCGCLNPLVTRSTVELPSGEHYEEKGLELEDFLVAVVTREIEPFFSPSASRARTIASVVTAAVEELERETGAFLVAFGRELTSANSSADIDFFHSLLSELRRAFLPVVAGDTERLLKAENLWQQGRILISDYAQRLAILLGYQKTNQNEILQNVNRVMITSFDMDRFIASLAEALSRLELKCCFLSLYEDRPSLATSRLLLGFVDGRRLDIGREGIVFPSIELAPVGLLPKNRRANFIVHPLYFEKDQLGFIMLEEGPQVGIVNEILRAQLSAAVQGALLFQERGKLLADLEHRARELQSSTEDLARANSDLEQFAVIASHDLKEPLRKISLFADRLKAGEGGLTDGERREYLDRMQAACLRMKTLIQNLLTYSRLSSQVAHFTRVALTDAVRGALEDLAGSIRASKAVIRVDALPSLPAESHHLRLLFFHLIDNALKFRPADREPSIHIFSRQTSQDGRKYFEITVRDNGLGIEAKYYDKIFGVFQRLHGQHEFEGTGMGLAVCKKIVERHQGAIRVESALGQGTDFIVTLPGHEG
jgi:DNA-binding LacI/PurR family transcriptional regulator/signal transduction histidine kinase